jgi:hypothetical protein
MGNDLGTFRCSHEASGMEYAAGWRIEWAGYFSCNMIFAGFFNIGSGTGTADNRLLYMGVKDFCKAHQVL